MDLYFDNKKIDNKYIYKLGKSSILFDKQFYLGATLCTQVELQIDKRAISSQPNYIYFKDGTTKLLTLIVDSVDDTNLFYYDYILTDCMILFNREFDLSTINSNTVQGKLNALCSTILGTTAPTINYIGDMVLDWNENSTPRKLISFIGEVNGCYAYIDGDNKLVFANQCYQAVKKTIQVEDCSDFALGEKIKFDRVVYDYGTATYKWPTDDNYTDVGNQTYYVQDDNFLLTDSGNYTIGNIVKRIYDNIHDFEFYNIEVSKCLFDSTTKAGELISFANGTNNYITIAQYEWTYNGSWVGGFSLKVDTEKRNETKIVDTDTQKEISIIVDRALGEITQRVSDVEGNITTLQQDSESMKTTFVKKDDEEYQNLVTNITFDTSGVNISSSNVDTNLQLSAGGVAINDNNNVTLAKFEKNNVTFSDWVLQQSGNVFNIFKIH